LTLSNQKKWEDLAKHIKANGKPLMGTRITMMDALKSLVEKLKLVTSKFFKEPKNMCFDTVHWYNVYLAVGFKVSE
jgi:hypothetical protein